MKDEIIVQFTEKGKKLNEAIRLAFEEWLKESEMTEKELLKYKDISGFHIKDEEDGYILAYYENDDEKYIGIGIGKESLNAAYWVFGYICALLDNGSGYKSDFSKEYLKWGAKHEQR